jgi:hypothetical protein
MYNDKIPLAVRQVLSNQSVWWEHAQKSTIEQFLDQYTLHDSYWLELQFLQTGSCLLLIRFDTMFVDPSAKKLDLPLANQHYVDEPFLCIKFTNVHQILSDHAEKYVVDNVILHADTKRLTAEEREQWLEHLTKLSELGGNIGDFLLDENTHCTSFKGTAHNYVHLIHSEPTFFLCVKSDGSILKLPDLVLFNKSS